MNSYCSSILLALLIQIGLICCQKNYEIISNPISTLDSLIYFEEIPFSINADFLGLDSTSNHYRIKYFQLTGDYESSGNLLDSILKNHIINNKPPLLVKLLGDQYFLEKKYHLAKTTYRSLLSTFLESEYVLKTEFDSLLSIQSLYNLGIIYRYHEIRTDSSFYYFNKVEEFLLASPIYKNSIRHFECSYAEVLYHKRDYLKGLLYIKNYLSNNFKLSISDRIDAYRIQGLLLKKLKKYREAELSFDYAIEMASSIKNNFAINLQECISEAMVNDIYLKDSISFFSKLGFLEDNFTNSKYANTLRLRGYYYFLNDEYNLSIPLYEEFLNEHLTQSEQNPRWVDEAYFVLAVMYDKLGSPEKSVEYQMKNYFYVSKKKDFSWDSFLDDNTSLVGHPRAIHYGQTGLYLFKEYKKTSSLKTLKKSFRLFSKVDSVLFMFNTNIEEEALLNLLSVNERYCQSASEVSYLLYALTGSEEYLNWLITFTDRNKGYLLCRNKILRNLGDGKLAQNRLQNLSKIRQSKRSNRINQRLFLQFNRFDAMLDSLSAIYPNKFLESHYQKIPKYRELQGLLKSNEAVCDLSLESNILTTLFINMDTLYFNSTYVNDSMIQSIASLQRDLSSYNIRSPSEYAVRSKNIFKLLFGYIEDQLDLTDLIYLISNSALEQYPFSTLVINYSHNLSFDNQEFLIDRINVVSTYSFKQLMDFLSKEYFKSESVAFFSPRNNNKDWQILNGAKKELKIIQNQFQDDKSCFYIGRKANFLSLLKSTKNDIDIFHFATHANTDLTNKFNNYLLLSEGSNDIDTIFGDEISNMAFDNRIILLNGCSTGSGTSIKGEGIYHLTKSFLECKAGCVINSLWELNDHIAQRFTQHFYSNRDLGIIENFFYSKKQLKKEFHGNPAYWGGYNLII